MKKYLLMALSVLMATTFVACGDDDDDPVEEKTKEAIVDVYAPVFTSKNELRETYSSDTT